MSELEQELQQLIDEEDTPIAIDDLIITHINGAYRIYTDEGSPSHWHLLDNSQGNGPAYPTFLDALKKVREVCNK